MTAQPFAPLHPRAFAAQIRECCRVGNSGLGDFLLDEEMEQQLVSGS